MISPEFLELLACPACDERPPLRAESRDGRDTLVCTACGRVYPINDGIPELLVESAILPEGREGQNEPQSPGT